jgi:hypothetical protein
MANVPAPAPGTPGNDRWESAVPDAAGRHGRCRRRRALAAHAGSGVGLILATGTNFVLHGDPAVLDLARQMVHRRRARSPGSPV